MPLSRPRECSFDSDLFHGALELTPDSILTGKATSAETADLLLLDVVPLSLGVAMEGNIFAPVVPRGQTVPTIKKRSVIRPPRAQVDPQLTSHLVIGLSPLLPTTSRLSSSPSTRVSVSTARTTPLWASSPLLLFLP